MSDATKMVTVTCSFGIEIPVSCDLDSVEGTSEAYEVAADDMSSRSFNEMKEAIDDIKES